MEQKRSVASWIEAEDAFLKKAWKDGKTASQIVLELAEKKLNPDVDPRSRNAVIGRAHRLHLIGGDVPARPSPIKRKSQSAPESQEKPDMRMTYEGCRWIHGDGADRYTCGKPQRRNKPFCEEHCNMAYTKKADKTLMMMEKDRRNGAE